jgi:putative intracellular protease/amidase
MTVVAEACRIRAAERGASFAHWRAAALGERGSAAVICHRPWTVVEADLVCGRTLTSWPSAPGFPGRGGDGKKIICEDKQG